MEYCSYRESERASIEQLFEETFTQSAGAEEGASIGRLVSDMMSMTDEVDLFGFVAKDSGVLVGGIFLTRLRFEDPVEAFILSPVAVHPEHQGRGIGQGLIKHGIDALRGRGVALLFTYGDPNYYAKVGFRQIGEDLVQAPHAMSQPIGWLCQSLATHAIPALAGKPRCVAALDKPEYW